MDPNQTQPNAKKVMELSDATVMALTTALSTAVSGAIAQAFQGIIPAPVSTPVAAAVPTPVPAPTPAPVAVPQAQATDPALLAMIANMQDSMRVLQMANEARKAGVAETTEVKAAIEAIGAKLNSAIAAMGSVVAPQAPKQALSLEAFEKALNSRIEEFAKAEFDDLNLFAQWSRRADHSGWGYATRGATTLGTLAALTLAAKALYEAYTS